ncbi:hypothetical protein HDU93_006052, partial [Gonapodya sp. JEL0774]
AVDTGVQSHLSKLQTSCLAPQTLRLKTGALVMLIKNKSLTLVNGALGKVTGFSEGSGMPLVK